METLRKVTRRRRVAGAVVAVVVTVAVIGVMFAARSGGGGQNVVTGSRDVVTAASPDSSTTPATGVPDTTATTVAPTSTSGPAATSPRAAPTTTATHRPVPSTTTTTAPASATTTTPSAFGQLGPEVVTVPYAPGQSSWEATSNGITLRLRIEPAAPVAGQPVTFHLEAQSASLSCCGFDILYGDGGSSSWKVEFPSGTCRAPGQGPSSVDYSHVYNKAGRWEFLYQVIGSCGGPGTNAALHGSFDVAAGGPSTAQGPALPTLSNVGRTGDPYGNPTLFQVTAQAEDVDGYITRFVIDWGDGSPTETFPGDGNGCRPTASGWPARSDAWLQSPYPSHTYPAGALGTITVTAVSSGCDGTDQQTVSQTLQY
jgi:hypothetical protein